MANTTKNKQAKALTTKKGATYTFGGEYYARQDKGLLAKTYKLAVTFPELLQAPLSVFKKGVSEAGHPIRNLMVKSYPDFTSVRTYNVLSVANNTNSKPNKTNDISVMNIEQLKTFIDDNDLGIDVQVYDNAVDKVRAAITLAQENPEKFAETYANDVKEYEYKKELEALNSSDDNSNEEQNSSDDGSNEEQNDKSEGETDVDDLLDDLDGDDTEDDK